MDIPKIRDFLYKNQMEPAGGISHEDRKNFATGTEAK